MPAPKPVTRKALATRLGGNLARLHGRRSDKATRNAIADVFDTDWYLAQDPGLLASGVDPVMHYVRRGVKEGREPHPLFDSTWYLEKNRDVAAAGVHPFLHYVQSGGFEGRDPNPLFDSDWYLATYPDVAAAGINPMLHYTRFGAGEGRDPNPLFDTSWYAETYPDVVRKGINPLAHFLHIGEEQRRVPGPLCARRTVPMPPTATTAGHRGLLHGTAEPGTAKVTIIVPVHGAWHWTERCLFALQRTEAAHRARVIVVDDASPDDTASRMKAYPWVDVVRSTQNLGFVGAVNLGLSKVRTPHVLLLNNDTEPLPGFLDAMLGRVERDRDVAVVGARLVYPDGRLQDAGSIVWTDGSGWNYGRHQNPDNPAYLYTRDVDYCTGAALLVRSDVLDELGGLHEAFRPAYYEDTDLAFAVRARGYRVVYEPEATVIHHEGGTHGTDEAAGVKSHQAVNREVFRARWRSELREQPAYGEVPLQVAATRGLKPIVVFVDHQPLTPDRDSGSFRSTQLLRLAREMGYSVVFAALHGGEAQDDVRRMRAEGIQVIREKKRLRALLRSATPWVEAVVLSRVDVAWEWFPVIKKADATVPVVFDTVDLHHLREQNEAELHRSKLGQVRARATELRELDMINRCDATIVVSDGERRYLETVAPEATVAVVSNIHPMPEDISSWWDRSGLLFVGSFLHSPNVDGLGWFLSDVWPRIDSTVRSAGIDVVGPHVPPDLKALASDEIRVHGWVPDTSPFLRRARIAVAPLRYGAGVKGKIGEAWSFGLPVVGTTIALDAMYPEEDPVGVRADDPEVMARRIEVLYGDEMSWHKASEDGRSRVSATFSVGAARRSLREVLDHVTSRRTGRDTVIDLLDRRIPPELLR